MKLTSSQVKVDVQEQFRWRIRIEGNIVRLLRSQSVWEAETAVPCTGKFWKDCDTHERNEEAKRAEKDVEEARIAEEIIKVPNNTSLPNKMKK